MKNPLGKGIRVLLLAAALLSLLPAVPAVAGPAHDRDGWLIGLGYGYGRGRFSATGDDAEYEFSDGATPQIRFGRMMGSHLALHLEYGAWMFEEGVYPIKARASMQNVVLAATWYPGEPTTWTGGFYVRGGAGLGWASLAFVLLDEEYEQSYGARVDEEGLGVQAALGYEWRITGLVAAGLGIGVQHLDIGGDVYDKTTFLPITMNVNWYWD